MFTVWVKEDGTIEVQQTSDGEQYDVDVALTKDNQYYIRCKDHEIISCQAQCVGFIAPPLVSQTHYIDGVVVVRFVNSYGISKKSEFTANVTLVKEYGTAKVLPVDQVFEPLRV
jgi:hypothetical protein